MSTTIETIMNSKGAMLALAIIAFLMAAVLVLVIVRMLFGGRLRMPGGRARQARLGIVDAFDLDRQRQLIIVRRDNTEHLIMIGGPNDLLIESEIVRVEARDLRRDKAPDFMAPPADGRIPAPFAPTNAPDFAATPDATPDLGPLPAPPELPRVEPTPAEVPYVPSPAIAAPASTTTPRGPTFPLPPRRPAQPLPERRPRTQDEPRGDLRAEMAPSLPPQAPSIQTPSPQAPSVQVPADPPMTSPVVVETGASTPQPAVPAMPLVAPAPATPRTQPPSFLKPLPPRPPIRPLTRTNPKPPTTPVVDQGVAPIATSTAAPTTEPTIEAPPAAAPKPTFVLPPAPPQQAPQASSLPPREEPKDALESLEEEMAKLLGRGPGS